MRCASTSKAEMPANGLMYSGIIPQMRYAPKAKGRPLGGVWDWLDMVGGFGRAQGWGQAACLF